MPLVDLSQAMTYRRSPSSSEDFEMAVAGGKAAGWGGVTLPAASVLGVTVFPIVEFTGAPERIAQGVGPERSRATLALWESLSTEPGGSPLAPLAPLRILGFASTESRWDRALRYVQSLAGLGAGLVVRQHRPSGLQLLDADVENVWVAAQSEGEFELCVRGRVGPVASAFRVPATRLIEEGLFAHAIACGSLDYEAPGDTAR